jgi:hypothetical protein
LESFTIKGNSDFITLKYEEVFGFPETTCHWGGYDAHVILEIQSGGFYVKSKLYTSTGELFEFFQKLKICNEKLNGSCKFITYEKDLEFVAEYDNLGHVIIKGEYSERSEFNNKLIFEFFTDQTFINVTLKELEIIIDKYGNMQGSRK